MDIALFRTNFPEFADTVRYPSSQLTFWSTVAEAQVNKCAWKNQFDLGVQLYVAHEVTLAAQNTKVASFGGVPGTAASGPVTSKTVGGATIAFDAAQAAEKDAGYWNLTSYGKQFIRLARMYGAGAIQLNGNGCGRRYF